MLAVIVIALGIAGTFALFPVGVNANKDATAENSIADIAEYVTAFVRADILTRARGGEEADGTLKEDADRKFNYRKGFHTGTDGYTAAFDIENPGAGWKDSRTDANVDSKTTILKGTKSGIYLVRQMSGSTSDPFIDFSAVARVYLDDADDGTGLKVEYFPDKEGNMVTGVTSEEKKMLKNCFLPAILELSWPAHLSYDEREKRYFRFEIFNDHYRLQ